MKREASLDISRIETLYSVGSAEDEKQEPANHQLSTLRLLIAHVGYVLFRRALVDCLSIFLIA